MTETPKAWAWRMMLRRANREHDDATVEMRLAERTAMKAIDEQWGDEAGEKALKRLDDAAFWLSRAKSKLERVSRAWKRAAARARR